MFALEKYKNKKIAIYGMGITGCSAAKTFKTLKAKTFCWDDDAKTRKKIKNLKYNVEKFWLGRNLIDNIVISPGIDINKCKIKKFLKKNFNKIITDLDIFFELNKKAMIISITGTNGKSTTCKIIEKILRVANRRVKTLGNIGNPILFSLKTKKNCIFILEVSSYQLQYSKVFRSKHAAILNVSPDHLERHRNITNYTKVKTKIFYAQKKKDFLYLNKINKHTKLIKKIYKKQKIKSKLILINKSKFNFLKDKINNKYFNNGGNFENLIFAYNIAKNLKLKNNTIIKAINEFKGLPHRQEVVLSSKKILCINDSKATSFDASLQSLLNYNNIYWILGGLPKKKDIFILNKVKKRIIKAYLIGKNISFFRSKVKNKIPYVVVKNIKNAVDHILKDIKSTENSKKTILLSPAAASFDQFDNFEKRGIYFKNLIIKKLKKK